VSAGATHGKVSESVLSLSLTLTQKLGGCLKTHHTLKKTIQNNNTHSKQEQAVWWGVVLPAALNL
jgi:hypothetical protein